MALAVGDWFSDGDQKTDLLLHRSIVTHGPLLPIIVGRQLRVAGGTMDLLALVFKGELKRRSTKPGTGKNIPFL